MPGRLSIILAAPDELMAASDEDLLHLIQRDADRLGLELKGHVLDYCVIRHPTDFYSFAPGTEHKRPSQRTSILGLTLAGDYTKQPYLQTMEGTVVSGQRAASVLLASKMSKS